MVPSEQLFGNRSHTKSCRRFDITKRLFQQVSPQRDYSYFPVGEADETKHGGNKNK